MRDLCRFLLASMLTWCGSSVKMVVWLRSILTSGVPSRVVLGEVVGLALGLDLILVVLDQVALHLTSGVPSHVVITDVLEVMLVAEVPSHVVVTDVPEVKLVAQVPSHVVVTDVLENKLVAEVPSHVVVTDVLEVKLVVVLSVENLYQCVEHPWSGALACPPSCSPSPSRGHRISACAPLLLLRALKVEGRSIDADIAAHRPRSLSESSALCRNSRSFVPSQ